MYVRCLKMENETILLWTEETSICWHELLMWHHYWIWFWILECRLLRLLHDWKMSVLKSLLAFFRLVIEKLCSSEFISKFFLFLKKIDSHVLICELFQEFLATLSTFSSWRIIGIFWGMLRHYHLLRTNSDTIGLIIYCEFYLFRGNW